jgi:two-component sensor histidine kinase/anti-anti-sigma regulatory factor
LTLPNDSGVTESDHRLDRLASVGQIAAGIAHEVKNPLTVVKGFLQLLRQEAPHKYLDYAFTELENAISTMENLLHVSKPDLANEPFDIIDLCSELDSVLHLFQERFYQVSVHKQFWDTDARIYGKRNPLKKALFNLLKNAFEAIPDDGVITITHTRASNHVIVSIADSGCGIPVDKLALLGTPFYTSKVDGTGIGLTQVFTTIYEHGGFIRVRSELDVGTDFLLHLPLWDSENQHEVKSVKEAVHPDQPRLGREDNKRRPSRSAESGQQHVPFPVIPLLDHVGLLPLTWNMALPADHKARYYWLCELQNMELKQLIVDLTSIDCLTEPALRLLSAIMEQAAHREYAVTLTGIHPELMDVLIERRLVSRSGASSRMTLQQFLQEYIKPSNL